MTTPNENEKNMCPNTQLVEVERKEEKMTEATQANNKKLLSPKGWYTKPSYTTTPVYTVQTVTNSKLVSIDFLLYSSLATL
jgi:hypothetical protein